MKIQKPTPKPTLRKKRMELIKIADNLWQTLAAANMQLNREDIRDILTNNNPSKFMTL